MSDIIRGMAPPTRPDVSGKLRELNIGEARDFGLDSVSYTSRRSTIYVAAKRLGISVRIQKQDDTLRVWRLA